MLNHSKAIYSVLNNLYLGISIALLFSVSAISAQVDCIGCTPVFDNTESTISVSCEILNPPTFPAYANGCTESDISEETFVATLGHKTSCEGTIAQTIGAGQNLCLSLYGFASAGLAPSDLFFVGSQSLVWTHYSNGSATLTGVVYNDTDPSLAYNMDVYLEGGFNWTEWEAMGKQALDGLFQDTEEDWIYFIMLNNISKLIGVGSNLGQTISLQHAPLSEDLGFQLGSMGANNINLNNGLSGWISWETLQGNETLGGPGDINIDLENCVETDYTCADDNDILYRFFAGNLCGYDEVDILIDHTDNTPPSWTFFPNDELLECSDTPVLEDATATDLCSEFSISLVSDTILSTSSGNYIVTRTFTATDACGNSITDTQNLIFQDTTPPTLSIPEDYTIECSEARILDSATAVDLCSDVIMSLDEVTIGGSCIGEFSILRTFTATDDAGNTTTATQTISIVDTTAPSLIPPADLSLSCLDSDDFGTFTTMDLCSDVVLTISSDTTFGACPADYIITRTFTASDNCSNSVTASQTIEYSDITPPTFGITPSYIEVACTEEAVLDAEALDSCSEVSELSYTDNPGSGGCMSPSSNIVRVLTAVDACGNLASMEQTIQFIDTVAPIFTYIPSDASIDCSTDFPYDFPQIMDVCSEVSLDYTVDTLSMSAPNDYTVSLLWIATDGCGNEKTADQLISVSDTQAPVFNQAPNLPASLEFGVTIPTCNSMEWTAVDNCYPSDQIIFDCSLDTVFTDNGPCSGPFEIHYAFSLSDPSGNISEFSHVIMISDSTLPVWAFIPENSTASCDGEIIWDEPIANGVNGIVWEFSIDTIPGICPHSYELIRTMTPTDGCGITGDTHTHSIFVSDEISPEFIGLPTDIFISCEEEIPFIELIAIDNCTEDVLISDSTVTSPGSCEGNYVIVHDLIAEDICGNTTMAYYTISITDTIAPVFTNSPEDLVLESGEVLLDCSTAEIQIEDNCSSSEWTCEEIIEPGTCIGSTNHLRTYTATDACGNVSYATQIIMILDTTAPEFTYFPSSSTLPCDGDTLPLATDLLTGFDLGSPDSLSFTFEGLTTGGDDCNVENIRIYRVTDDCGNYLDSAHVTILIDTVPPTLNTPLEDLSFTCFYDMTPCDANMLDVSDNCNITTSFCADYDLEGDCDNEPCSIERIYTISDICGNSLDISQIISITASPTDSLCDTTIAIQEPSIFSFSQPSCVPYPNPIRATSQGGSVDLLRCPDMTPWILLNSLGNEVARGNSNEIQIDNLTQGLYFLRATGYGTQRIVVLK